MAATQPIAPPRWRFDLIRELALTQFKLKYTGSALGYLWSLVKPLLIFGIMYAVFVNLLHVGNGLPNFPLQLLIGVVFWTYFSETIGTTISVVVANGQLIKKAYFPRLILVISATISASLTFIINVFLILLIAALLGAATFSWSSFALLGLMLELYLLIFGACLGLAALYVFYRDVGHLWEVASLVLFYASAVVYPLSPKLLGNKVKLLALNPVAQIIEDVRHAVITPHAPWTADILGGWVFVPWLAALVVGIGGFWIFWRMAPRFAEYL